jgi:hypothetical protein
MKEKERSNLIFMIKKTIHEWIDDGTAHILLNIPRVGQIILQIAYISVFIISATYCVFSVWISFHKYFQFDSITSIEIVTENPVNFPAVTFCNINKLNATLAETFLNGALNEENNIFNIEDYVNEYHSYLYDITDYFRLKVLSIQNDEHRRSIGFELKDMLLQCNFNWISCDADDFTYFFDNTYGNCFTFNSKNETNQSRLPGPNYGLSVDFFVGDPDIHSKYEFAYGIIVIVHNQTAKPILNSDRTLASTGAETDLKISRNFISKLGPPYGYCVRNGDDLDSEFYDHIVNDMHMPYTQEQCYELCLQKQVLENCGCGSNWFDLFANSSYCTNINIKCVVDIVSLIISNNNSEANNDCLKKCPLACETVEYKIKTSRSTYPTPWSQDLISKHSIIKNSGMSPEKIDKAISRIHVYYESMTYTKITETKSLTALTLFSQIGGTLGLCLGISILSFVKLFGLIISILNILKQKIINNTIETRIEVFTISSSQKTNFTIKKGVSCKNKKSKEKSRLKNKTSNI